MSKEEEEIWRTYPDIPFIEVSNLGKIRTKDRWVTYKDGRKRFVKGQILKQQLNEAGYMYVVIGVNGKKVHLLSHRAIAASFLPNPNNWPEINHKDNNPKNNAVSNLEWCTRGYNEAYKKNFGTSQAEVSGRPVFAVNLKTGKILYFDSQSEAARQLGIKQGQIWGVLKGEKYTSGGYWFTEDKSEITEEKIREIKANMKSCSVIAIKSDASEVFWFESQREAEHQLGIHHSLITRVVKGHYKKTHGYWFCYADEDAVEKTREKFGDKVAIKVKELMSKNNN